MTNPFQPAERGTVPVKIALVGPSGSGKTYTALRIAHGIADGGKVALIDTEHGSASLYADEFAFDTNVMTPPYQPSRFAAGIAAAAEAGYSVLVIDGISPAWNGPGGVMEIVDANAKGGNSWSGWAKGTPEHQKLIQAILACPMHLICTMRVKTEWVLGDKNKPEKVGLAPVQRDGMDYEFSVVGELDLQHRLHVTKSRLRGVDVDSIVKEPDEDLGRLLVAVSQGHPRSVGYSAGSSSAEPDAAAARGEAAAAASTSSEDPDVSHQDPPLGAGSVLEPSGDETPILDAVADAAEHRRAHETPSTADLKLDPAARKVITKGQADKFKALAQGYGLSGVQALEIIRAQTGKQKLELVERYQFDALLAEVELVGGGVPK